MSQGIFQIVLFELFLRVTIFLAVVISGTSGKNNLMASHTDLLIYLICYSILFTISAFFHRKYKYQLTGIFIISVVLYWLNALKVSTVRVLGSPIGLSEIVQNIFHADLFTTDFVQSWQKADTGIWLMFFLGFILFLILRTFFTEKWERVSIKIRNRESKNIVLCMLFVMYFGIGFFRVSGNIHSKPYAQVITYANPLLKMNMADKPQIILFFLFESSRKDIFHKVFNEQLTATHGLKSVPGFFAPVPHTSVSLYTLLTGRYSFTGKHSNYMSIQVKNSMSGLLQEAGYELFYLTSGVTRYENVNSMMRHFGFSVYDKEAIIKAGEENGEKLLSFNWGVDDKILFQVYRNILGKCGKPKKCFILVHYSNAHSPYFNADKPETIYSPDADSVNERYLSAIQRAVDTTRQILSFAPETNSEAGIFITSDHGESFGENGYGKHGFSLNYEEIAIPFLYRWPGSANFSAPHGSLADMYATLNDLLQMREQVFSHGISLFHEKRPSVFLKAWSGGATGYILENEIHVCDRNNPSAFSKNLLNYTYIMNQKVDRCFN